MELDERFALLHDRAFKEEPGNIEYENGMGVIAFCPTGTARMARIENKFEMVCGEVAIMAHFGRKKY